MEDGRIQNNVLYGKLAPGVMSVGWPKLHLQGLSKRVMKALDTINTKSWETATAERGRWRSAMKERLNMGEKVQNLTEDKRARRKKSSTVADIDIDINIEPKKHVVPNKMKKILSNLIIDAIHIFTFHQYR